MKRKAILWLFFGVFGISFAALLVRYTSVSPSTSAFYRILYGTVSLILIIIVTNFFQKRKIPKEVFSASLIRYFFLPGLFVGIDFFIWHKSIHIIGSGLATVIANSQVLFSAILGFTFLKEKLSWHWLLILPIGFIGISLIAIKNFSIQVDTTFLLGSGMALFAGFIYSIFLLLTQKGRTKYSHIPAIYTWTITTIFCGLTVTILGVSTNDIQWVIPLHDHFVLIILGFFVHAISWILITKAIPYFPLSTIGISLLGQPVLASILGILVFHESITSIQSIGLLITLGVIVYGQIISRNNT